jgi:hypothetical protein
MSTAYWTQVRSNAKVFLPAFALACALRIILDMHNGYLKFVNGLLGWLHWLSPCVLIAMGVSFFWNLFRYKGPR